MTLRSRLLTGLLPAVLALFACNGYAPSAVSHDAEAKAALGQADAGAEPSSDTLPVAEARVDASVPHGGSIDPGLLGARSLDAGADDRVRRLRRVVERRHGATSPVLGMMKLLAATAIVRI